MVKKKIVDAISSSDPQTKRWKSLLAAGKMAYESGEFRQAESLLARAMELAHNLPERSFAENSTQIGAAAILLAEGKASEAARRLDKTVASLEGFGDNAHKELLGVALRFHALALIEIGDEREAERELERAAEILQKLGEDGLVQWAFTMSDLCGLFLMTGRFSEAEQCIRPAVEILCSLLGPDSPEYTRADMIYQLCAPMELQTRLDAVPDSIRKLEYRFGAEHPNIARALNRYINVLERQGDSARIDEIKSKFGVKAASRK